METYWLSWGSLTHFKFIPPERTRGVINFKTRLPVVIAAPETGCEDGMLSGGKALLEISILFDLSAI